jgi:hypothetical protein
VAERPVALPTLPDCLETWRDTCEHLKWLREELREAIAKSFRLRLELRQIVRLRREQARLGLRVVRFEQTRFPPLRYDPFLGLATAEEVQCSRLPNAERMPNRN